MSIPFAYQLTNTEARRVIFLLGQICFEVIIEFAPYQ
jgi:hypothetical protein